MPQLDRRFQFEPSTKALTELIARSGEIHAIQVFDYSTQMMLEFQPFADVADGVLTFYVKEQNEWLGAGRLAVARQRTNFGPRGGVG